MWRVIFVVRHSVQRLGAARVIDRVEPARGSRSCTTGPSGSPAASAETLSTSSASALAIPSASASSTTTAGWCRSSRSILDASIVGRSASSPLAHSERARSGQETGSSSSGTSGNPTHVLGPHRARAARSPMCSVHTSPMRRHACCVRRSDMLSGFRTSKDRRQSDMPRAGGVTTPELAASPTPGPERHLCARSARHLCARSARHLPWHRGPVQNGHPCAGLYPSAGEVLGVLVTIYQEIADDAPARAKRRRLLALIWGLTNSQRLVVPPARRPRVDRSSPSGR